MNSPRIEPVKNWGSVSASRVCGQNVSRFAGSGKTTPPLTTVLFEIFAELRLARAEQDAAIEKLFENADREFLRKSFPDTNNQGKHYVEEVSAAARHFFNHQTHHRGQLHVMLAQTSVQPPSL